MNRCEYCGQEWQEGQRCCWACGAARPERTEDSGEWYQSMLRISFPNNELTKASWAVMSDEKIDIETDDPEAAIIDWSTVSSARKTTAAAIKAKRERLKAKWLGISEDGYNFLDMKPGEVVKLRPGESLRQL